MNGRYQYIKKNKLLDQTFKKYKNCVKLENILEKTYKKTTSIIWFIVDMMIVKKNVFLKLYPKNLEKNIKEEINKAKINENDKVLHIGCGPYPVTAILINKLTGAKVTAIDKNNLAVEIAQKYLVKNKIENVEIKKSDGGNISAEGFDVVVITSTVTPQKRVIDNIIQSVNNNCIIIYRELTVTKNKVDKYMIFNSDFVNNNIITKKDWNSNIFSIKN